MSDVSTDRLREILAGCEGVTPGPWSRFEGVIGRETHVIQANEGEGTLLVVPWDRAVDGNAHRDAAYIASLDPQTISAIISELVRRREADAGGKE
jgi:hypothetical protein